MGSKGQVLFLVGAVVFLVFLADRVSVFRWGAESVSKNGKGFTLDNNLKASTMGSFQTGISVKTEPMRNWNILDPELSARAVVVQSLDDYFPFYHMNVYAEWPAASLVKIMTAIVALDGKATVPKAQITARAIATEETAGGFRLGEVYGMEDLLKIMILTSSNDAAVAIEDAFGGREAFVKLLNRKAMEIGMSQTVFFDASGVSSLNTTTASDVLKMVRHVLQNYPNVFNWSRTPSFLVQPINSVESRVVENTNPLVDDKGFLGGKTGTSVRAKENLAAVFSMGERRVVAVILGSDDRMRELKGLFEWIKEAYGIYF